MVSLNKKSKSRQNDVGKIILVAAAFCFIAISFHQMSKMPPGVITSATTKVSAVENSDDFKLAYEQSYGFFDSIPTEDWERYQDIVAEYEPFFNPNDPLQYCPGASKRNLEYFNSPHAFWGTNYEPNFSCPFERRLGGPNGNGDGPKWVCDPHRILSIANERKEKNPERSGCLVYSVGSNGHYEFENGIQNYLGIETCEVHIFDMGNYTAKTPKDMNMHYHMWGLRGNKEGDEVIKEGEKFYSIAQTVKLLGHEDYPAIDIFKIDCEKCEWATFKDWFGPTIPSLTQILVELHGSPHTAVIPFFEELQNNQGYVTFHKEPNIQFAKGDAIEYAFLKLDKGFFKGKNSEEVETTE